MDGTHDTIVAVLDYDRAKPRVAFVIVLEGDEPYMCGVGAVVGSDDGRFEVHDIVLELGFALVAP